jgi:hypothetical protein
MCLFLPRKISKILFVSCIKKKEGGEDVEDLEVGREEPKRKADKRFWISGASPALSGMNLYHR